MSILLQTGQTRCYDARGQEIACRGSGQDGERRSGSPWPTVRFEALNDTVVDRATGLVWTRNANPCGFGLTWMEAFEQLAALNQAGYAGRNGWRMPNRNELRSLVSYAAKKPALPEGHPFENVFLGWYWSSTTAAIHTAYAWAVHFEGARMFYTRKDQYALLWPVCADGATALAATGQSACYGALGLPADCRGTGQDGELRLGSPWPVPRFERQGDLVRDRLTGLFWPGQAALSAEPVTWEEALESALRWARSRQGDGLLWGLPTINELASLTDCSRHSPALPEGHPFTGVQDGYWASTTSFFETGWAWVLYMEKGACGVGHKPGRTFYAWPVGRPEK